MNKIKKIDRKNIPFNFNIYMPFIIYTLIDYWKLPTWVFAVYLTVWVIVLILAVIIEMNVEKVDLFK